MRFIVVSKTIVVLLVTGMIVGSCAGDKGVEPPAWANDFRKSDLESSQYLSRMMVGGWIVDDELSDDSREVMVRAFKNSELYKYSRGSASRDDRGGPLMSGAKKTRRSAREFKHIADLEKDPRLQAAFSRELKISFSENKLGYKYKNGTVDSYPISGEPVVGKDRFNTAFGEWEYNKFVIEKNGPRGSMVEHWTLSPDGQQLHLHVQIQPNTLPEKIIINRLFTRQKYTISEQ